MVLFVHGATGPGVPDFDLGYKDYNWMTTLARAGFDTYAVDLSGYGSSPRPGMDDPCNASAKQQQDILTTRPLKAACPPSYPFQITTIRHEREEIDTVVDHLRRATGRPRVNIIGWSAGGPRVGGYVSLHPEKIDRVVLYAPSPTIAGLQIPDTPSEGNPLYLQTKDALMHGRWAADEKCEGQVDPGIREVVWRTTLDWDRIGRSWGPEGEGVMRSPPLKDFGWSPEMAAKVVAPTLVVGEFDRLAERRTVFEQLGSKQKVFLRVACASHFMVWEKQHMALQRMSLEWLQRGTALGQSSGEIAADKHGVIARAALTATRPERRTDGPTRGRLSSTCPVQAATGPLLSRLDDVAAQVRQADAALRGVVAWASWRLLGWMTAAVALAGRVLSTTRLMSDPLVALLPEGDAPVGDAPVTAAQLGRLPLILYEAGGNTRAVTDAWFRRAGITPRPVMELGSVEAIKTLVGSGLAPRCCRRWRCAAGCPVRPCGRCGQPRRATSVTCCGRRR